MKIICVINCGLAAKPYIKRNGRTSMFITQATQAKINLSLSGKNKQETEVNPQAAATHPTAVRNGAVCSALPIYFKTELPKLE